MTIQEMRDILYNVEYPGYALIIIQDSRGAIYLQAEYDEADIATGETSTQRTRRWFLSPEMVKSEIVSTAFKCILTSAEHRCREHFKYKGKRIFGPHFDVDMLASICNKGGLDYRGKE